MNTAPASVEAGIDAFQTIGALAAVAAALFVFMWLLKRGTFAAWNRTGRHGLAIESALPLGERRSLVVVAVEGRRLLLGLSPTQVGLIAELDTTRATFDAALTRAVSPPEGPRS
jgi:flagellar protein FliO/FliZ